MLHVPKTSVLAAAALVAAAACAAQPERDPRPNRPPSRGEAPQQTLRAFRSEQELAAFLRQLAEEQRTMARQAPTSRSPTCSTRASTRAASSSCTATTW